jgi:DNA-binding response OmpR family regulator
MTPEENLRVVIVEDDQELSDLLVIHLEKADITTQVFGRGQSFLEALPGLTADLILLDVNLPDHTGYELMKKIEAANSEIPVIFLTGRGSEKEKVKGLDSGADDYITKPFSPKELLARIRAVVRRSRRYSETGIFTGIANLVDPFDFCGVSICPKTFALTFPDGSVTKVGKKELGILAVLNHNKGRIISRTAIIRSVWGPKANPKSRSLDQYVVKLRNLLERNNCDTTKFRTIHGIGYAYDA